MTRDISLYVKDILENMSDALKFVENMTYEEFEVLTKKLFPHISDDIKEILKTRNETHK